MKQITNTMIQTFNDRIAEAEGCHVFFPQDVDLIEKDYVRGVYGFFKSKDGEEECFYVGKTSNMRDRMIGPSGHITEFLHNRNKKIDPDNKRKRSVPIKIAKLVGDGYTVNIRIIKIVPYDFSKSYEYNANLLCLEELSALIEKQNAGECVDQLSESVKNNEKRSWNSALKAYEEGAAGT